MKHLKFTYVDAITGVSVAAEPAMNGTKFPAVPGLAFAWARESQYPAPVPEFFGTCPDASPTQVDGVLGVFSQSDWEQMQADEMRARIPAPISVSPRQIRQALTAMSLRANVEAAVLAGSVDLQDWWHYSTAFVRNNPQVTAMGTALGVTDLQLDALWALAASL